MGFLVVWVFWNFLFSEGPWQLACSVLFHQMCRTTKRGERKKKIEGNFSFRLGTFAGCKEYHML